MYHGQDLLRHGRDSNHIAFPTAGIVQPPRLQVRPKERYGGNECPPTRYRCCEKCGGAMQQGDTEHSHFLCSVQEGVSTVPHFLYLQLPTPLLAKDYIEMVGSSHMKY